MNSPYPLSGEQIRLIEEAKTEKDKKFVLPQEAIDYVLCRGSDYSQSKLRIYEQFSKQESKEKNIAFLKSEYGTGGHSNALPESGYWEQHDGKGIEISKGITGNLDRVEYQITWNAAEKRIGELIKVDRYLTSAEREAYPAYKRETEDRNKRSELMREFRSIFEELQRIRTGSSVMRVLFFLFSSLGTVPLRLQPAKSAVIMSRISPLYCRLCVRRSIKS